MEKTNHKSMPKEKPLAVAIAAVIKDNKILLIKRIKGDYVGLWGLPGGKIEKDEHFGNAARREIMEESGIDTEFQKYLGLVSEHLIEDGKIMQHFLLHVSRLFPKMMDIAGGSEGMLEWFELDSIGKKKDLIIPSDLLMIEKMAVGEEGNYFECVIEKSGDSHMLKKFE